MFGAVVMLIAGMINGVAGFGFALVGTMALASVVDPATAVVFMIVPILLVNLSLTRGLSLSELETCGRRFAPLMIAALLGTVVGMMLLDRLPAGPLRIVLGIVSLGFVLNAQRIVSIPGRSTVREGCFVETPGWMVGIGGVSGVLFGGTNVGVQLVAYVRSCDLSEGLFIGVIGMVFVGLNGIRVILAGVLGLYPDVTTVLLSIAAALPALVGVSIGTRLRVRIPEVWRRRAVLWLLTIIGLRLVIGGLGVL
ncbi:MAG: sulfite exporter TauE/SafE family protein [Natronomonas sp.]